MEKIKHFNFRSNKDTIDCQTENTFLERKLNKISSLYLQYTEQNKTFRKIRFSAKYLYALFFFLVKSY